MTTTSFKLRLAAIDFLNAAPLMWGLESDPRLQLSHSLPSACADALSDGTADLGVIPVVELARIPDLVGLAGLGVGARGQVRSILLIGRVEPEKVRTVALDAASRTSAALAQVLLRERWGASCEAVANSAGWRAGLERAEAVLVIGDPALRLSISGEPRREGYWCLDLAQEWHAWTALPFVFALWGVRRAVYEAHADWLPARLAAARRQAAAERELLIARWTERLRLPAAEIRRYLERDVEYDLGADHLAGMRRFFTLAAAAGILHTAEVPQLMALPAPAAPSGAVAPS